MAEMKFINPYSFVSLQTNTEIDRNPVSKDEKRYTGVIDYSLMTKTPLVILNTTNKDTFKLGVEDHKSYDFFSYTDLSMKKTSCAGEYYRPVIPGSEIRGMLRSYYEILTNSCLSMVDEKKVLSKRTEQVFSAGLIKREADGGYSLWSAIDHLLRTYGANSLRDKPYFDEETDYKNKSYIQDSIPEGSKVFFDKETRDKGKPFARRVTTSNVKLRNSVGYILKGAPGPTMEMKNEKHCAHIFVQTSKCVSEKLKIEILDTALNEYEKARSLSEDKTDYYEEYRDNFQKFKNGLGEDYFPVYYSIITGQHIMLSPAAITREISNKRLGDILNQYKPCNTADQLCPACRLFGTMRDNSFSASSRIRFSDLEHISDTPLKNAYEKIVTLPELSSPKISCIEFYVKRPSEQTWFWTYDYYIEDGKIVLKDAEINGRKIYWHHKTVKTNTVDPEKRNMTVRPLKAKQVFRGKLFFNDIIESELNQLIYLMNSGEDDSISLDQKKHGYKLGAAKPLGFGSVALKVDGVTIRTVIMDDQADTVQYKEEPYERYVEPEIFDAIKTDFSTITAFDSISEDGILKYPCKDDHNSKDGAKPLVYEWFERNHKKDNTDKKPFLTKRIQMGYRQYMKPLEEQLASTGYGPEPH